MENETCLALPQSVDNACGDLRLHLADGVRKMAEDLNTVETRYVRREH